MTPQEAIDAISLVETTDQEARIQIATILEQVQPAAGIALTPEDRADVIAVLRGEPIGWTLREEIAARLEACA